MAHLLRIEVLHEQPKAEQVHPVILFDHDPPAPCDDR
jgi:hypothetical protein